MGVVTRWCVFGAICPGWRDLVSMCSMGWHGMGSMRDASGPRLPPPSGLRACNVLLQDHTWGAPSKHA